MTGKHEVVLPTINDHQVAHHLGDEFADWLVAEWGYISAYSTELLWVDARGVVMVDTSTSKSYDDSDTPTEFWCREHMVELGLGVYEVDYV